MEFIRNLQTGRFNNCQKKDQDCSSIQLYYNPVNNMQSNFSPEPISNKWVLGTGLGIMLAIRG